MNIPKPQPTKSLRPQIVLFGDSITQRGFAAGGWGARLADHYVRKADIINRGFSGYNSTWAGHAMQKVTFQC